MEQQIPECDQKLGKELGQSIYIFHFPTGHQKNHLYNQCDRSFASAISQSDENEVDFSKRAKPDEDAISCD